ncbi:MAG: component of the Tol biopolymer transport system, partial [Chloroflexi bacterium]
MGRIQVWALVWGGAAAAVFLVACSSTSDGTADGAAGVEDAQSAPTRDAERADTAGSVDTSAEASGGAEAAASVEGDEDAGGVEGEEAASEGEEEADEDVEVGPVRFVGDPFVGACWALPEGEFRFAVAPLLSCEGPHQSEVFWLGLPPLALLQAGYSESELFDAVGPICNAALFGYQGGSSSESLQIFVQLPTEEEWAAGRFVYSCSAFDGGGQLLAGSLRVEAAGFPLGVVFAAREREAYVGLRFVRDDGLAIPVDVASPNGVVRDVAWFPDGQRVVFAARGDNSQAFNLFTLDGLQRPLVQLTDTFADNVSPTVSPDGTRIAFASARDGNLELYV